MHDIKWIRDNPAVFDGGLARRGLAPEAGRLIEIDERRRAAIGKAEAAQARRNDILTSTCSGRYPPATGERKERPEQGIPAGLEKAEQGNR